MRGRLFQMWKVFKVVKSVGSVLRVVIEIRKKLYQLLDSDEFKELVKELREIESVNKLVALIEQTFDSDFFDEVDDVFKKVENIL